MISRVVLTVAACMVLVSNTVICAEKSVAHGGEEKNMTTRTIQEVLKEHTGELMAIPGVVGTGQGICDGKPCIKVYIIEMTPELSRKIPPFLEGYPVAIEETGEIRALPKKQD